MAKTSAKPSSSDAGSKKAGKKAKKAQKAGKKAKKAQQEKMLEDKVLAAYALDPSAALAPFLAKPFTRNGLSMTVVPTTVKGLSSGDKKWVWALLEKNMRPVYGEEAWGGGEGKDKKVEMLNEDARYLVAREEVSVGENDAAAASTTGEGAPLGFVHYRYVRMHAERHKQRQAEGQFFSEHTTTFSKRSKFKIETLS
jgi:hypothetical protein